MNLVFRRYQLLLFLVAVFLFGSACRLQEFIVQYRSTPTAVRMAAVTRTPTPTLTEPPTDTPQPTVTPLPTDTPAATNTPPPTPSRAPVPPTVARVSTPIATR